LFDNTTQPGKGILRSETYLTSNYEPEEPVGRNKGIEYIAEALRPLARRHDPDNLLIYGPAGVGKTTCVKHVTQKLENEASIKSIYINCWQYNTRSSLLTELLIQLGYPAPRKGKPVDELLGKIREWLDKNRGVAVVLDEFDQLNDQTEVIYDIQMVNEQAENAVGLLMVSNQHPTRIQLDPRSRSRLNCHTLEFQSYNAPQLEQILQRRVQQAFRPGTVPDEVIEEIAEQVAENSGDCRKALRILLRAGREAEQHGDSKISVGHVQSVGEEN
jgi:cell division control protein 6